MYSHKVLKVVYPQGLKEIMAELNEKRREVNEERVNTKLNVSESAMELLKSLDPAEVDFFESKLIRPKTKGNCHLPIPEQETLSFIQRRNRKEESSDCRTRASEKESEHGKAPLLNNSDLNYNELC